ncbi:unnamed protein product [Acanthoscelides obtectus]|uniref:Uncharacterized protein n=1 Tax=Acanthoscelides obtectus TaxID=200917 RepID=A0A9P0K8D1_ACAOB|nr:unnamed protein product [Acanthoscelides obtectus]CAK1633281.1 hypothetical protein AOBTE_LOCUS8013 [Acanthoscelides obtectus]
MKKKFKSRKSKNIAEKNGQSANYRFTVNPLIKQELLHLLNKTSSTADTLEAEGVKSWSNFYIPGNFKSSVKQLAKRVGVNLYPLSTHDLMENNEFLTYLETNYSRKNTCLAYEKKLLQMLYQKQ